MGLSGRVRLRTVEYHHEGTKVTKFKTTDLRSLRELRVLRGEMSFCLLTKRRQDFAREQLQHLRVAF
jgi:hypothetical protein